MRTIRYLATCTIYGFLIAVGSLQLVIFCIGYIRRVPGMGSGPVHDALDNWGRGAHLGGAG